MGHPINTVDVTSILKMEEQRMETIKVHCVVREITFCENDFKLNVTCEWWQLCYIILFLEAPGDKWPPQNIGILFIWLFQPFTELRRVLPV